MDSSSNDPIRLSDSETRMLTRALLEAQEQAGIPTCGETETQFIRRTEGAENKVGHTQQVQRGTGNMIL